MNVQLTQITGCDGRLYGLDKEGRVWAYVPANKETGRFAFWSKLTDFGKDPADKSQEQTRKPKRKT